MTETTTSAPTGFINWLCDGIAHACLVIAALSLLCIVAINGANVVARYFFGVFTGAVAVTWRNLHIRIDTLIDRLPPTLRRVVSVIATLASIAILSIVMVASFRLVALLASMDQRSDALHAPSWIPQSFVTIGLGLMALMMLAKLVTSFRR